MPPFVARNALKLALAAAAVALALVIGFETNWGMGYSAPPPSPGGRPTLAEAKLLPPLPNIPAEQAYPETGARPLFTPVRRPAPAGQAAGSMVKGQFALNGVIVVDGLSIAMLKEKSSGKTLRVEKGKEINGLTVAAIERDRVTLTQGEDSEVVALLVQRSAGAPMATGFVPAGPFSGSASATSPGAVPGQAPQATVAGSSAGGPMPTPGPATQAAPVTRVAPASGATPSSSQAGTAMEDVLARSRARRAQRLQEQQEAAKVQNVQK